MLHTAAAATRESVVYVKCSAAAAASVTTWVSGYGAQLIVLLQLNGSACCTWCLPVTSLHKSICNHTNNFTNNFTNLFTNHFRKKNSGFEPSEAIVK